MRIVPQSTALVLAAVLLAACGGATPSAAPATAAPATAAPATATPAPADTTAPATSAPATGGSAVEIKGFAFGPTSVTVAAGQTVTWTNKDSAGHTVTADDGSFDSGRLAGGATFSQVFATAGTYTYHCAIHSSMKATVIVQ